MNYCWPGRLHLIVLGHEVGLYFTLWLFGRRFHIGRRSELDTDGNGWMAGAPPNPMKKRR